MLESETKFESNEWKTDNTNIMTIVYESYFIYTAFGNLVLLPPSGWAQSCWNIDPWEIWSTAKFWNMYRYTFPVTVVTWKKGPMTQSFNSPHSTFIFGVSLSYSSITWGFWHPHMRELYLLIFPQKWKDDSSQKQTITRHKLWQHFNCKFCPEMMIAIHDVLTKMDLVCMKMKAMTWCREQLNGKDTIPDFPLWLMDADSWKMHLAWVQLFPRLWPLPCFPACGTRVPTLFGVLSHCRINS